MADEKYVIPEAPKYRVPNIRKLQDRDPVSASGIVNPTLIEPILESIAYHEKHKAELSEDGKIPVEQLPAGVPGGVAGLDDEGKVPPEQLPALGGHIAQAEAPDNTNLLWIDTENGSIIKFYDPGSETWKPVGAIWS
ncbi:MAG: hypothetical protein HFE91_05850 [Acutalibacter sp.]|jgi:hypothetical protein|uniref:hypothetical protein n=1 Tax=Acutalibacter sp. TaxID=1918636 RepID=UPI00216E1712|nr:hypothetical protein [Acutalibacter sp.]MCI9224971.1 hypothetical protein [Acutalibacter sp.]